jgi:hypothetical protein
MLQPRAIAKMYVAPLRAKSRPKEMIFSVPRTRRDEVMAAPTEWRLGR